MTTATSQPDTIPSQAVPESRMSPSTSPAQHEVTATLALPGITNGFGAGPQPSRDPGRAAAGIGETLGKITHLWSYDSPVGVWVFVDDAVWRRLSPASQSGHSHMTLLATVATHANLPVYYNLDSAGQIDRMYV